MNPVPAIMLILTIITSHDKPNITHQGAMPDLRTCLEEADKFLQHKLPDFIAAEAKGLSANCVVKQSTQGEETPS